VIRVNTYTTFFLCLYPLFNLVLRDFFLQAFLDNMDHDYQLVLCSATINAAVRAFARDIMEIEKGSPNFVTVGITRNQPLPSSVTSEGGTDGSAAHSTGGGAAAALLQSREGSIGSSSLYGAPLVRHWSTAVRVSARAGVAADLVSTLNPRTAIVFVATKVECDAIAEEFGALLAGTKVLCEASTQTLRIPSCYYFGCIIAWHANLSLPLSSLSLSLIHLTSLPRPSLCLR